MDYYVSARDYLQRARKRLDDKQAASLFYAAFELRCGIEQRQREYLEYQDHVKKKEKDGWRIVDLDKTINKAFKGMNKIARLTFTNHDDNSKYCILYYTPVTDKLVKIGGRLGEYLHAMGCYHPPEERYWHNFSSLLETAYQELDVACSGNLKGVPMIQSDGRISISMELDERNNMLRDLGVGTKLKVKVEYLNKLPTGP